MRAISIGVLIDIFYVEKLSSRAILIPSFSSTLLSKNAPMIKNIISDNMLSLLVPVICVTTAKTKGPIMPANLELIP